MQILFDIVIFIHYKPRIAVAILGLRWIKINLSVLKIKENYHLFVKLFHVNFPSGTTQLDLN